jgi:hypothetical protein
MRSVRFLSATAFAVALVGGTAASSSANSPYTINNTQRLHKAIEFDADVAFDTPCLVASADVTEVFNEQVHILATGIDQGGNYMEPLHIEDAREESLTIVPHDPALPTYTGHSTAHTTNLETSPNAVSTNTITLRGTDGSHLLSHENVHLLVRPSGITLFVDNFNTRANCG